MVILLVATHVKLTEIPAVMFVIILAIITGVIPVVILVWNHEEVQEMYVIWIVMTKQILLTIIVFQCTIRKIMIADVVINQAAMKYF